MLIFMGIVAYIKLSSLANRGVERFTAQIFERKTLDQCTLQPVTVLPEKLIICYADHFNDAGICDIRVYNAAVQGCNVIIWFSISIGHDPSTNHTHIYGIDDFECIANSASKLRAQNISTIHLISVGKRIQFKLSSISRAK